MNEFTTAIFWKDGTVEPSDDQREQFLELESMRKRPCSQTASRLLPELPLILMTAVATHLVMSFAQTLMHYKLGHNPIGGKFFRNHINFHHAHYSKARAGSSAAKAAVVTTPSRTPRRKNT